MGVVNGSYPDGVVRNPGGYYLFECFAEAVEEPDRPVALGVISVVFSRFGDQDSFGGHPARRVDPVPEECSVDLYHGVGNGVVDCQYHDPWDVVTSGGGGHGCTFQCSGGLLGTNCGKSVNNVNEYCWDKLGGHFAGRSICGKVDCS